MGSRARKENPRFWHQNAYHWLAITRQEAAKAINTLPVVQGCAGLVILRGTLDRLPVASARTRSEHDVDIYIIIFPALAVVVFLCLRSVLGQRTGSERPFRISAFAYRLSMIAAVLCAVDYVAYEAKWYSALEARVTPITTISGPARVVDGDSVVVAYYWQWHSSRGLRWSCLICIGRPKNRGKVTT